jgi:ABC-type sugar transport system substrate-binding protein
MLLTPTDQAGAQTAAINWSTAHPNAKYVVACLIVDSAFVAAYANAFKGRASTVAIGSASGGAGNPNEKSLLASGSSAYVGSVDNHYELAGTYVIAMAEDIFEGLPVPVHVGPKLTIATS